MKDERRSFVSQAEELLKLYSAYVELSDDDPKKIQGAENFTAACVASAKSEEFYGP